MNEIEVTPEMLQAGVDWLDIHPASECSTARLAEEIYRAMERVRLSQVVPITAQVTKVFRGTLD